MLQFLKVFLNLLSYRLLYFLPRQFMDKLDWGSYIISIAKTASKESGALIRFMKFVSLEVALYLYKSTTCPCMEYCHSWAGVPNCYLGLLGKLEKGICGAVGPSLSASLEPFLAQCWNVVSLSLFYRHYIGRYSSELARQVSLLFCCGSSTCYFDRLYHFFVTIPRCCNGVYVNSFFPCTALESRIFCL